jgi:hypothetical protein
MARAVQLIARVTPVNAEAEMTRLCAAFGAGRACLPRWEYAAHDVSALDEALRGAAAATLRLEEPLRSLVVERIEEIRLEVANVGAVGTPAFAALACGRFKEGEALLGPIEQSKQLRCETTSAPRTQTDSGDARSLLSQVRTMIGEQRVGFAVRVVDNLQALAATGERTVYVARGRLLTERVARRVATHEVMGHVLPRVRAQSLHPLFALGTARGTDDQEGLALMYEERAGLLDGARRVELELRHRAAAAMRSGADFVEVARMVLDAGAPLECALRMTARVFRGSDGTFPGLGRESVYLPALARVKAHLAKRPGDERLLASGQVAVEALSMVRKVAPGYSDVSPGASPTASASASASLAASGGMKATSATPKNASAATPKNASAATPCGMNSNERSGSLPPHAATAQAGTTAAKLARKTAVGTSAAIRRRLLTTRILAS